MSDFLKQQTIPGNPFLPRNNNSFCWHYPQACQFNYQGWACRSPPFFVRHMYRTPTRILDAARARKTRKTESAQDANTRGLNKLKNRKELPYRQGPFPGAPEIFAWLTRRLVGLCIATNN
jgi:phosphoglycolate phosphatase-like HAD superfamily hydrolase